MSEQVMAVLMIMIVVIVSIHNHEYGDDVCMMVLVMVARNQVETNMPLRIFVTHDDTVPQQHRHQESLNQNPRDL